MKHITIKDIARHLSLSVSTVSRALVNDKNIRRETKEKVLEAAKALGYKPNPVATNLKYGHTNTVGVIVPEMVTPFASQVINGIQSILYANGLKVIIAESHEDPQKEKENLQLMERFMVDGIIICLCSYKENKEEYLRLQQAEMPMVFYDRIPHGLDVSQVTVDDYMKTFFLVEHLIRSGRKRIVHLQGPDDVYNSTERTRGYKDALSKFKIPIEADMLVKTGLTFDDGAKAADLLIEKGTSFDAIFAFTDTLAIGAMNRLRELDKKIPEEIAIASFSGTVLSTIVYPQLTTVEPPLQEMGRTAAELILEKIKNPASPNRSVVLDAEIQIRASSGKGKIA
ncbi:LacI family DNA-binding transcriptional regulator [uncultured Bacteroides sp.]|uniref:LacI family DNA-binding transcriptional regulator n=1 Tax=uncultured Bacteroides sp. TaxID=162156 RepID=UPI0025F06E6B|nr:LacI family DNA-binding transcriptional regulator [uncultured Bacteroides sp.]